MSSQITDSDENRENLDPRLGKSDQNIAVPKQLPVTEKLLRKLKKLRRKDPNLYPLY